ncbi:MAG TPA: porin [Candidatus Acidoferrales bacterium]|nr:porin [Candidatus Acidoferrales bacterium]
MNRNRLYILLAALALISKSSLAADSTATSPITWNAFIDAYYTRNFNDPSNHQNGLRNFDIYENQITLGLADLTVQKQAQPVGFKVELGFGTTSDWVNTASSFGTPSPSLANVMQAYGTVVVPVGAGLTVDVGKFVTHMGNEVIVSQGNWNYSRSYLFTFAIPYYHTGIRFTYPVLSNLTAALHIVNGWNSVIDNNKFLSIGATLNYSPTSSTDLVFNGMWGHENLTPTGFLGSENGARDVYDFIITQQLSDAFQVAVNADYGQAGTTLGLALWKGVALYERCAFASKSALALREEVYYDPEGYTTATVPKATFQEYTLTYEYHPFDPLLIRIEGRDDFVNGKAFTSALGIRSSQPTLTVGVVTSF